MTSKVKRELTYLIPFSQKRKSQLLACLAVMLSTSYRGLLKCCPKKMGKEIVLNKGEYTDKELNAIIEQKMKSRMNDRDDILSTSRLYGGTKITISLNELDNSDNLEDGHPSNTLFMD